MKMQENPPLRTPEDMLALAEALAARYTAPPAHRTDPRGTGARLPRWANRPQWVSNLLWALGGAGAVGLCWLSAALG